MNRMIPYAKQDISDEDIDSVIEVLKSDFLTQGNQGPLFEDIISKVDATIIVTAHDEFKKLDISLFNQMKHPILIDTRGIIDPLSAKQENLIFRGLGRGQ